MIDFITPPFLTINFNNLRNGHLGGGEAFDELVEREFAAAGIETEEYTDADKYFLLKISQNEPSPHMTVRDTLRHKMWLQYNGDIFSYGRDEQNTAFEQDFIFTEDEAEEGNLQRQFLINEIGGLDGREGLSTVDWVIFSNEFNENIDELDGDTKGSERSLGHYGLASTAGLSEKDIRLYNLANADGQFGLSDKEVDDFQARLESLGLGKIEELTDEEITELQNIAQLDKKDGLSDKDVRLHNLANTDGELGLSTDEVKDFQTRLTILGLENIENLFDEQLPALEGIAELDGKEGLSNKDIRLYNLANTDGQFGLSDKEVEDFDENLNLVFSQSSEDLSDEQITELEGIVRLDGILGLSDQDVRLNKSQLGAAYTKRATDLYNLANTDTSKILSNEEVDDFKARLMDLGFGKIEDLSEEDIVKLQNIARLDNKDGLSEEDVEMHLAARKFYEMWGQFLLSMQTSES